VPTLSLSTMPGIIRRTETRDYLDITTHGPSLGREDSQVASLADIRAAIAGFEQRVRALKPEASFMVSVTLMADGRKPSGYDAAYLGYALGQAAFLHVVDAQAAAAAGPAGPPAPQQERAA